MSDLKPKEPRLHAVLDKTSNRNLLDADDPSPLEVNTQAGESEHELEVVNSAAGPIDIEIGSDEPWLSAKDNHLSLLGGQRGKILIKIGPTGTSKFAHLTFTWPGAQESRVQTVLIARKLRTTTKPLASHFRSWPILGPLVVGACLPVIGFVMSEAPEFGFFGVTIILACIGVGTTRWLLSQASPPD